MRALRRARGRRRRFQTGLHFGQNPLRRVEADVFADTQFAAGAFQQIADAQRGLRFAQRLPCGVFIGASTEAPSS